jgi:hypothetical protein
MHERGMASREGRKKKKLGRGAGRTASREEREGWRRRIGGGEDGREREGGERQAEIFSAPFLR